MPQVESSTHFKRWLFATEMRGFLRIMLVVVSNACGNTAMEISENTGIKPMYVELTLGLLSGTG
ncbi:MAG: hypothetical protein L7H12_03055 [Sulfolobales archaeon]|nr:hypothetical protein [Sulfolobales archaeon]MCG2884763.1 hypothetical protein [Sulfolobales archaeon]MCG2907902.1 hypothetical protein [Sulfolobales archaeon]